MYRSVQCFYYFSLKWLILLLRQLYGALHMKQPDDLCNAMGAGGICVDDHHINP